MAGTGHRRLLLGNCVGAQGADYVRVLRDRTVVVLVDLPAGEPIVEDPPCCF